MLLPACSLYIVLTETEMINVETAKEGYKMPKTSDNDKKAHDNNAKHMQKNMQVQENYQASKHDYSKKTDHR